MTTFDLAAALAEALRDPVVRAELVREADVSESDTTPTEAAPTTTSAVLTVDELADLLRVERKSAYAAIARGEIPGVRRIGRTLRVSRAAVLRWLLEGQGRVSRSRGLR